MFDNLYTQVGAIEETGFKPHIISESGNATLLSQFCVIQVTGPDSERFLQGQLTCDLVNLTKDTWVAGACCTAKGRMVANFIVTRIDEGYCLRLPKQQAEPFLTYIKKYAAFFKANLQLLDNLVILATLSNQSQERRVTHTEAGLSLQWVDGREEIWCESAEAALAWLNTRELCAESLWHQKDIELGWCWVTQASTEAWVPQYIGWQHHQGISFTKGCYTGQEVIARMQYLGKSKRNLYALHADSNLPEVMTPIRLDTKNIGEVSSCLNNKGLAVISRDEDSIQAKIGEIPVILTKLFYTDS